jgi:hypothetical protein
VTTPWDGGRGPPLNFFTRNRSLFSNRFSKHGRSDSRAALYDIRMAGEHTRRVHGSVGRLHFHSGGLGGIHCSNCRELWFCYVRACSVRTASGSGKDHPCVGNGSFIFREGGQPEEFFLCVRGHEGNQSSLVPKWHAGPARLEGEKTNPKRSKRHLSESGRNLSPS